MSISAFAFMKGVGGSFITGTGDAPAPLPTEGIITEEDRKSLSIMTQKSARVNVLIAGTDGGRADTIMVMSYDPIRKLVDIVSIPRDTYHKMPGYDGAGMYKINASYALRGDEGGIERVRKEISSMLNIPIHYTVDMNYNAVREVIDIIGGVEVNIDKRMKYDDIYSDPPLHIDFQPGVQVLDGQKAIEFLRWRKNNRGVKGYGEGDIQRIERQQQFVKDAIAKAFGLKLPMVIQAASNHIKTDMPMKQMLYYAGTSIGMDTAQMRSYRIPGTTATINHLSYFIGNPADTETMMLAIYNRQEGELPLDGTIDTLKKLGLEDTVTPIPGGKSNTTDTKSTTKKETTKPSQGTAVTDPATAPGSSESVPLDDGTGTVGDETAPIESVDIDIAPSDISTPDPDPESVQESTPDVTVPNGTQAPVTP